MVLLNIIGTGSWNYLFGVIGFSKGHKTSITLPIGYWILKPLGP